MLVRPRVSSDHGVPENHTWVWRGIENRASQIAFLEERVRVNEMGVCCIVRFKARNYQSAMNLEDRVQVFAG